MAGTAPVASWLQSKELKIVKGVYKAPGDNNSVETDIVTMNLLSDVNGISLAANGWSPNIPLLKNSGIWADSPQSVGRTLIGGADGNVIETMRVLITGSTLLDMFNNLMQLNKMIEDCREFWTDNAQINPVYLHWFANSGKGRQYALIYNMEASFDYKDSSTTPLIEASLTIEREPYWRFLPPGANPKQWTYEYNNQVYSIAQSAIGQTDSLVNVSINNKSEFNSTYASLVTGNFVTIPAAAIPGDAPALILLTVTSNTAYPDYIIGKKTVKPTIKTSVTIAANASYNATDGTLGTDATRVNDTGACKPAGGANGQRVEVSFATATNQLRWRMLNANINQINRVVGRWMVFMRCRQVNGALGDITMYLRYGVQITTDLVGTKLNVANPPLIGTTGATTVWGVVYMGVIELPILPQKGFVAPNTSGGSGLSSMAGTLDFGLYASKVAGTQVLYINDIILIPVDEGSISTQFQGPGTDAGTVYDNTGFLGHGATDDILVNDVTNLNLLTSLTVTVITLTPGVENRLYMVEYSNSANLDSSQSINPTFRLDIIPRCRGIRNFGNLVTG